MLEIIVAILYFLNKIFLYFEKKTGWVIGILASSLAIFYYLNLKLYIFMSLEVGSLLIMILGFIGANISKVFNYIVYSLLTLIMLFLLVNIEESGILEFTTSMLFIISYLALAQNKWQWGWLILGIAHLLMLFILKEKAQFFFSTLQGLSVVVCLLAILKKSKTFKLGLNCNNGTF